MKEVDIRPEDKIEKYTEMMNKEILSFLDSGLLKKFVSEFVKCPLSDHMIAIGKK